jgi:hypothetical protein
MINTGKILEKVDDAGNTVKTKIMQPWNVPMRVVDFPMELFPYHEGDTPSTPPLGHDPENWNVRS